MPFLCFACLVIDFATARYLMAPRVQTPYRVPFRDYRCVDNGFCKLLFIRYRNANEVVSAAVRQHASSWIPIARKPPKKLLKQVFRRIFFGEKESRKSATLSF